MDKENTFWFALWTMAAGSVLLLFTLAAYSSHLEDKKLVEMVKSGANPLIAKCALSSMESSKTSTMCVTLANAK